MGKKSFFILIILWLSLFIYNDFLNYDGVTEFFKVQNFDEIALKYYDDIEFTDMSIHRENGYIGKSDESKKIKELLDYLKKLEYKRRNADKQYYEWEDNIDISISTSNSGRLGIKVLNEKYITLYLGYIIESEDKERNITKIEQNDEYRVYKVVNNEIDMDFIESIYDSMEIEEY
ncbi:hypothetical protein [Senegalia sp. (in: firmicutes)]|uniref:hypothetical protein n=1 Tax=Senegalia sp. (in: firmicutes) TaxID=1924098 RepID=UPI003F9C5C8A